MGTPTSLTSEEIAVRSRGQDTITGVLELAAVTELESNDQITELWRRILTDFIGHTCDGIGFSGIMSNDQIARIASFEDWQPAWSGVATYNVEWDTPASGRRVFREQFGLFRISEEVVRRISEPMFHYWSATDDTCPADRLYFFRGADVVMQAEPYEEAMIFCNLTRNDCSVLDEIDQRVLRYLNRSRKWRSSSWTDG